MIRASTRSTCLQSFRVRQSGNWPAWMANRSRTTFSPASCPRRALIRRGFNLSKRINQCRFRETADIAKKQTEPTTPSHKSPEKKATEHKSADHKTGSRKSAERKTGGRKAADRKLAERKTEETEPAEPAASDEGSCRRDFEPSPRHSRQRSVGPRDPLRKRRGRNGSRHGRRRCGRPRRRPCRVETATDRRDRLVLYGRHRSHRRPVQRFRKVLKEEKGRNVVTEPGQCLVSAPGARAGRLADSGSVLCRWAGKEVPTETEWERGGPAARGPSTTRGKMAARSPNIPRNRDEIDPVKSFRTDPQSLWHLRPGRQRPRMV